MTFSMKQKVNALVFFGNVLKDLGLSIGMLCMRPSHLQAGPLHSTYRQILLAEAGAFNL